MKILMLWGQRLCRYEGEYAPELLEAVSEYADQDNPAILNDALKMYGSSGEFLVVRIIEGSIGDGILEEMLGPAKVDISKISPI